MISHPNSVDLLNWFLNLVGVFLRCLQVLVIPAVVFIYARWQRHQRRKALLAQLLYELSTNLHIAEGSIDIYQQKIAEFDREGKDPAEEPTLAALPSGWRSSVFEAHRFEVWQLLGEEAGQALQRCYDKMLEGLWKGDDQIPPAKAKKQFEEVSQLLQDALDILSQKQRDFVLF